MVSNLQSISKGCFQLALKHLVNCQLPTACHCHMQFALGWARFPARSLSFGLGHAGTRGSTSHHILTHCAYAWLVLGWEPLLIEVTFWPQCWPQASAPLQPRLGPCWLEPVSIMEKQCYHDNVCGRCWLAFCRINLASHYSPVVSQGTECPCRLVSGLQFVCGWCEGLPVGCVRVTLLHNCTFTILWVVLDLCVVVPSEWLIHVSWILQTRVPVRHHCLGSETLQWDLEMPFPVLLLTCQLPSSGVK